MADIALFNGTNVGNGFAGGERTIVTRGAFVGSFLENAFSVAVFAVQKAMLSGQFETGVGVIKIGSGGVGHGVPCGC